MENFGKRNKTAFVLYEFVGTAFLCFAANYKLSSVPAFLLLISVLAWELSAAHFNLALTVGAFFFDISNAQKNLVPLLILVAS